MVYSDKWYRKKLRKVNGKTWRSRGKHVEIWGGTFQLEGTAKAEVPKYSTHL